MSLICKIFGHDKYSYKVEKSDGKVYEMTYCLRCDHEVEKEVK